MQKAKNFSLRAFLIGIILSFINSYWLIAGLRFGQGRPTTMSLFFNVIFTLLILVLINDAILKISPKAAFSQAELMTIYVMLCSASAVSGLDMMQELVPNISFVFFFATPENEWAELFHKHIPSWLSVKNKDVLEGYYRGESSFYIASNINAWIKPILAWTAFVFALIFIMGCINVIVKEQWTKKEKLSYPIIQLPLYMTGESSSFLKNRFMWIGLSIAGGMDVINGLHYLYPAVPSLGGKLYDIRPLFTEKPFNAIGWTPVAIYPFAVGLSFFIPLDLSFSCWFFYLFWRIMRILGSFLGLRSLPGFPYENEQMFASYVGLCAFALWASRRHLKSVVKKVFGIEEEKEKRSSDQKTLLRFASIGIVAGFAFLTIFGVKAGMGSWVILTFLFLYFALSIGITRIRAELGPPVHDLWSRGSTGPDTITVELFGSRKLRANNLTMFALLYGLNRDYRSHPMPHQLEGFKIAEKLKINDKKLLFAIYAATLVGILTSFWAYMHISYKFGSWGGPGWEAFGRSVRWIQNPSGTDYKAVSFMGVGLAFTLILFILRMRFFWWPIHPLGYALSAGWGMNLIWFSILVGFLAKGVILKYGGLKTHRKAIPFFFGLILGEFIAGSLWTIIGIILHTPTYKFIH